LFKADKARSAFCLPKEEQKVKTSGTIVHVCQNKKTKPQRCSLALQAKPEGGAKSENKRNDRALRTSIHFIYS